MHYFRTWCLERPEEGAECPALELQMIVRQRVWVSGLEPWSSGTMTSALNQSHLTNLESMRSVCFQHTQF